MKRYLSALVAGFVALNLCDCHARNASTAKEVVSPPAVDTVLPIDFKDPGANIPPRGRSLFEYLTRDQTNPATNYAIPFPFEALLERVRAEGYSIRGVLIPRGRSLQRNAAKPDFFKFPRIVATPFIEDGVVPAGAQRLELASNLFIGYVEPANRLEVISFNEAMGRFEFQVVTDYKQGATPKIFYANRALCTACHQGQAPIFPVARWNETNENLNIIDLLKQAMPGREDYHGIGIETDNSIPVNVVARTDPSTRVNDFDDAVRAAGLMHTTRTVFWGQACGGNDQRGVDCRANLLKAQTRNEFEPHILQIGGSNQWSDAADIDFEKNFITIYPNGLFRPDSGFKSLPIPLRRFSDEPIPDLAAVANAVATTEASAALDPLILRRGGSLESFSDATARDAARLFEPRDLATLKTAAHNDFNVFFHAIDQLATKTVNGQSDVLGAQPFARAKIVAALLMELGSQDAKVPEGSDAQPNFPPQRMEGATADGETGAGDPTLVPFKEYCAPCHSAPPLPSFMQGTDAEVKAALKVRIDDILARLDWDRVPPVAGLMPPAANSLHTKLALPENSGKRNEMIVTLTLLKQSP